MGLLEEVLLGRGAARPAWLPCPSWEVALGMLGGTSVPRDLGRKLLLTPIYSGVLPEVAGGSLLELGGVDVLPWMLRVMPGLSRR